MRGKVWLQEVKIKGVVGMRCNKNQEEERK